MPAKTRLRTSFNDMPLSHHTTSLPLSKRLKKLGVPQKSLFWWVEYTDGYGDKELWSVQDQHVGYKQLISAFLASELGEMLPDGSEENDHSVIFTHRVGSRAFVREKYGKYTCYFNYCDGSERFRVYASTEADARAKMLIHLLEQKLITPDLLTPSVKV